MRVDRKKRRPFFYEQMHCHGGEIANSNIEDAGFALVFLTLCGSAPGVCRCLHGIQFRLFNDMVVTYESEIRSIFDPFFSYGRFSAKVLIEVSFFAVLFGRRFFWKCC